MQLQCMLSAAQKQLKPFKMEQTIFWINLLNKQSFVSCCFSAATNSVLAVPWNMQTESSLFYLSERAYVMIRYQSAGGSEI